MRNQFFFQSANPRPSVSILCTTVTPCTAPIKHIKEEGLQVCDDDILIQLLQFWTLCIVLFFNYNATQLYRFVRTSQKTHYVFATSPTG
jgi:hypothetical protein